MINWHLDRKIKQEQQAEYGTEKRGLSGLRAFPSVSAPSGFHWTEDSQCFFLDFSNTLESLILRLQSSQFFWEKTSLKFAISRFQTLFSFLNYQEANAGTVLLLSKLKIFQKVNVFDCDLGQRTQTCIRQEMSLNRVIDIKSYLAFSDYQDSDARKKSTIFIPNSSSKRE